MGVCPTSPHVLCGSGEGIRLCSPGYSLGGASGVRGTSGLRQGCPLSQILFIIFMDRIYRRSQGMEGVRYGDLRVTSLLFADDVVLLGTSGRELQLSLDRFATDCEAAGMRISTSKSETMVLRRKRVESPLWVGDRLLPQVEEFKYLGVLFTSDGTREREIDRWIGAGSAVMRALYRSVVVKKELSHKARLSIYRSIYVPTLTYAHELWRSQLRWFGHLVRMPPGRLPREVSQASLPGRRPRGRPRTRWRDYIVQLAWERLRIPLGELVEVAGEREVWASLLRMLPPRPESRRSGR
ncbi:hypothetical protein SRHO_G00298480 [Serrasalmus rhombeus]